MMGTTENYVEDSAETGGIGETKGWSLKRMGTLIFFLLTPYIDQLFIALTKHLRETSQRRKGLLWLTVLEFSVRGQLVPLL